MNTLTKDPSCNCESVTDHVKYENNPGFLILTKLTSSATTSVLCKHNNTWPSSQTFAHAVQRYKTWPSLYI